MSFSKTHSEDWHRLFKKFYPNFTSKRTKIPTIPSKSWFTSKGKFKRLRERANIINKSYTKSQMSIAIIRLHKNICNDHTITTREDTLHSLWLDNVLYEVINLEKEIVDLNNTIHYNIEGTLDVKASNDQLLNTNKRLETLINDKKATVSIQNIQIAQLKNHIKLLTNELRTTQHRIINIIKGTS